MSPVESPRSPRSLFALPKRPRHPGEPVAAPYSRLAAPAPATQAPARPARPKKKDPKEKARHGKPTPTRTQQPGPKARPGAPVFVTDAADLPAIAEIAMQAGRITIDTESNSLHAYREQVCWLQIYALGHTWLVDTIAIRDLSPLAELFGPTGPTKLLHGADYDVVCLKRDFGFGPDPIFDTMLAAQMLGHEKLGLGALVEMATGIQLDKAHTRHDWGARPVDPKVVPYLVDDVLHLEPVVDILQGQLEEADLTEEIAIEFERVAALEWTQGPLPDPEAWRRVKGAGKIDAPARSALRELHAWRDELAAAANAPAFKIFPPQALLNIARLRPENRQDLVRSADVPERLARRHAADILEALATAATRKPPPEKAPKPPSDVEAPIHQPTEEELKDWRREACAEAKLTPQALLPNHLLHAIARSLPAELEAFEAIPGLGTRRRRALWPELLEIVRRTAKQKARPRRARPR